MKLHRINSLTRFAILVVGAVLMLSAAVWAATPVESNDKASAQSGTPVHQPSKMVLIPDGEFNMGDPYKEGDKNELPVHKVFVSPFYMENYLVTGKQWEEVYNWAKTHGYGFENTGFAKADDQPVQDVSWYDVVKWLNARSEKEGRTPAYYTDSAQTAVYRSGQKDITKDMVRWTSNGYRLPTEAEWEKAARGGIDGQHYPWPSKDGNYKDHIDCGKADYRACDKRGTTPVGTYNANGYGLYDMAGNVSAWVWDWYDSGWYGNPKATDGDTRGPDLGSHRVTRGGSWYTDPSFLRCAYRMTLFNPAAGKSFHLGFRAASGQL
ncbi:MAG: SUMF1/EgtB/PvdO family nonheme iron enzyme [Deltaproteobacteria bacterium]|nr:SUMF1/EgtB/PvdO family nonheme iron enzyme [Deltaproteobacteria bacterium]MBF0524754.1 SUMF1/EgtB/PvdO family nonheme iron enzyme [Deltaproteobacteria bacterium]